MYYKSHFSVGELSRLWGCTPRTISDAIYQQLLDGRRCPIEGGRRLIPADYVEEARRILRRAGRLPAVPEAVHV
jgi:hypothetical protein